jgi:hypothetical protein
MHKKKEIKTGLSFGIAMAVFFILQDLLTHPLTTKNILTAIIVGLFAGALSGLLFGWLIGLFANSKLVKKAIKIDIDEDENILFETPANHFKGIEAVGGKLYLTNNRLVFQSHKLNIQNHQLSLGIADIQKVGRHKTMSIINNGLSVTSVNGSTEKFVVEQPERWFTILTEKNGRPLPHTGS